LKLPLQHFSKIKSHKEIEFFWPQMALAYRLDAISQDPKNSRFLGPNRLPLAKVMDAARIKSITPYKS
jgi:hypothetical protein